MLIQVKLQIFTCLNHHLLYHTTIFISIVFPLDQNKEVREDKSSGLLVFLQFASNTISWRTVHALRKRSGGPFLAWSFRAMLGSDLGNRGHRNKKIPPQSGGILCSDYLLENCGARLAAFKPYFFLSFIRGSLVKKPAFFNAGR